MAAKWPQSFINSKKLPAFAGVFFGLFFFFVTAFNAYCGTAAKTLPTAKALNYTVLQKKPHNRNSFTQGLIFYNDRLIESSGLYGKSFIYEYAPLKHWRRKPVPLDESYFAEGITIFDGRLHLLTWRKGMAYQLDPNTFEVLSSASYKGQGWGLTHNKHQLIMSNGTHQITFRNPNSFAVERTLKVSLNHRPLQNINELEYAHGYIWANIWQTPNIVAIDPDSGAVAAILDLSPLLAANNHRPGTSVLNGIAYDPTDDTFWVTGKLWQNIYKIRVDWPKKIRS